MGEILAVTEEQYHEDPSKVPSLSASIAKILCDESPLHAWYAHPRLNPNYQREEAPNMDIGSVVHALVLQGENKACVLDFPDRRTKDYKQAHAAAMAAGEIPILKKDFEKIKGMVISCRKTLDTHRDAKNAFTAGKPEQTLSWREENGVYCRARLDWLHDDHRFIDDLKTRNASVNPDALSRVVFNEGWDVQAAMYVRGLKAIDPECDPTFRFVCIETSPPFALSVIAVVEDALVLGTKKVLYAIEKFGKCLESGVWPSYGNRTCEILQAPKWEEDRWLWRESQAV